MPKKAKGIFSLLELALNFVVKIVKAVFFFVVSFSFILLMLVLVAAVSTKLFFSALGITENQRWAEYVDKKIEWVMQQELKEDIREAFYRKNDGQRTHIKIFVSDQTDTHVRGEVITKDGNGNREGAIFLATKKYDKWEIVFDGNGAISCDEMEELEFPDTMIEDCV